MAGWDAPALPVRTGGAAKPIFVGRAAETAVVEQAWAAASAGARQILFVGGEPGSGKTRLVEETAAAAHRRGHVVLMGACAPEPGLPYHPFAECLEQLLGGTPEGALAECLPESARELLRLTPLVWRHRPDLEPPAGGDGDYRRELFDAFADLLRSVSRQRPVVCVIEDLHWAGGTVLQLLGHLAQASAGSRLLLVCTHRTTAPDHTDELTYAIADLYRMDGVRRLDLPGLSADEIAQYLVAEGGLAVRRARELAAVLRDHTGGNPFFLREVLRDICSRREQVSARSLGERAPATVRDTLQRRLSLLTPQERAALNVAAVLGDGAAVPIVAEACGEQAVRVLAAMETAAGFGLVDADELTRGRVVFPHTLTRQAVLDLIGPSRGAALHARVGEVLEKTGADSPRVVRQLAYHFSQAGALGYAAKAAEYLIRSAREAERSLAFEDAAARYAHAAGLWTGPEAECEELRFAAARCCVRAGDFAGARKFYLRLSESADRGVRFRAAVGYEDAGWRPGLPGGDACALLTRALDEADEDASDSQHVWALASLGRAMAFTGDPERARAIGEQALERARRLGDERLLTHALQTMMWHGAEPDSIGRSLALATELADLARRNGDWEALGTSAVFRSLIGYIQVAPGIWSDAISDMDRAVRGSGQPFMAYMRGCSDYAHAFLAGDFASAEKIAENLLELGRSFGPDDTEGPYGLQMFMVRRETGALEAVRPFVDSARQADDVWKPGLLALCTDLGLGEAARGLLRELLGRLDEVPARQSAWAQWTAVLAFLCEAAVALPDKAAAARLRPLLTPFTGLNLVAGQFVAVFGPADAYLASLDSVLGDNESAERLFRRALAQSDAVGSPAHRASVMAAWAAHLRRSGGSARHLAQVRLEARRLAASTGQVRLARMLEAPDGAPARLTAREIDVLRQLTRGASNSEIAARLRITENTAANHVRSILIKTGAANRTQAAMMAVSGHWVDGPAEQA